jgi:hypothetical protein
MYLSYSGYSSHEECNFKYYNSYIAKTVLDEPDNRVNMLYGDTVGKLFESFYVDKLWKKSDPAAQLVSLVKPTLQRIITNEIRRGGTFDWKMKGLKAGTRSIKEVESEVLDAIPRGLKSIRRHWLLGAESQAELNLDAPLEKHLVGGRADFLIRRAKPHGDLVLIDGKGSRYRDRYTNHRQLRWYAMQYHLKHGVFPDRLGFLYWRSEPDESLDWSEVDPKAIDALKTSILVAADAIEAGQRAVEQGQDPLVVFPTSPGQGCGLCRYLPICSAGKRALAKDAKQEMVADMQRGVEEGEISF